MMVMNGEEYLTAEEARGVLGVKAATLYAYVSRGLLASYRQGIKRQRLYKKSQVEALIGLRPGSKADEPVEISAPASRTDAGGDEQQIPLAESWIPYT
ncbi:MAG TPA: helix-turn-helix domain-containing protein [Ktedonobacterales bacterium]|jgi:citrate synthase